jgi:5'-3' exoribonuclease 1
LNGKKNDWEAVVKIPFIDERRLLDAMRPRLSLIASHDRMRMKFGESITARYDPAFSFHLQSTIPGILPDIINCKTRVSAFHLPTVDGITSLRKTIHPAARIGVKSLPGFPSLKTIAHSSDIVKAGIKVFQADSRNESVVITIHNKYAGLSVDELAGKLLGSKVYINWPYLQDAVLVKISDQYFDYILDPGYSTVVYALPRPVRIVKQPKSDIEKWHRVAERLESEYHHYKGISTGPVEVMIHVAPLKGMKRLDNGAIVKEYMT